MWKEIITLEEFNELATVKKEYGCNADISGKIFMRNREVKNDCHYFHYKSDKIELIKGYKQNEDIIELIVYTIKADITDYREAMRLMGEQAKEYLITRTIKKIMLNSGFEDEEKMNLANFGVNKLGFSNCINLMKEEYEKIGFKLTFTKSQVIKELI